MFVKTLGEKIHLAKLDWTSYRVWLYSCRNRENKHDLMYMSLDFICLNHMHAWICLNMLGFGYIVCFYKYRSNSQSWQKKAKYHCSMIADWDNRLLYDGLLSYDNGLLSYDNGWFGRELLGGWLLGWVTFSSW